MSKEAYLRNKVMTKAEFDKMAAVPILWDDDQIPPLVSLGNQKKTVEKASFQSLNQSDVKSVYTVDREDFGKNMLELINSSSSLQKENKTDRTEKIAVQPVVITDSKQTNWETPINEHKLKSEFQSTRKNFFSSFKEQEEDYSNCPAIKLYQQLVQNRPKDEIRVDKAAGRFQFDWMRSKSPSQLLANVLTNPSRMDLYVRYLLNQIYLNQQARIVNQLYQQQVRPYNPTLRQTYENILYVLSRISKIGSDGKSKSSQQRLFGKNQPITSESEKPKISLFQNGVGIDINPRLSQTYRQNGIDIRRLKMEINQKDQQLQEIQRYYSEIIVNYQTALQNLSREDQDQFLRPPSQQLQQSIVHLSVQPEQSEEQIRNKNHTFGVLHYSGRSSKDKRREQK